MQTIKSLDDLNHLRLEAQKKRELEEKLIQAEIILSMGTPAIAAGARKTLRAVNEFIEANQLQHTTIRQIGSIGLDSLEPIIKIRMRDMPPVTYGNITADRVDVLLRSHILQGEICQDFIIQP